MENVEDRAIRFNEISETAKIRILNNIMNNAEDEDGEYVGVNNDSNVLVEEDSNKQFAGENVSYEDYLENYSLYGKKAETKEEVA